MANSTDPFAESVHGTNPQNLIEKITRLKIYNSNYWKEHCFGLTAETIIDKAITLKYCGGVYAGNVKPTAFLCLCLKLLQLQPEKEIVLEYIQNEDFKYLRLLGAFYLRMTGKPVEIYQYLEPLYNDYRKIAYRGMNGWEVLHIDEFADALLYKELVCDVALPHLPRRVQLEDAGLLGPRVSALEDLIDTDEEEEAEELVDEEQKDTAPKKERVSRFSDATKEDVSTPHPSSPIASNLALSTSTMIASSVSKESYSKSAEARGNNRSRERDPDRDRRERRSRERDRDSERGKDRSRDGRGSRRHRSRSRSSSSSRSSRSDRHRSHRRRHSRSREREGGRRRGRHRDSRSRSHSRYRDRSSSRRRRHSRDRSYSHSRSRSYSRDRHSRSHSDRRHRRSHSGRDHDVDRKEGSSRGRFDKQQSSGVVAQKQTQDEDVEDDDFIPEILDAAISAANKKAGSKDNSKKFDKMFGKKSKGGSSSSASSKQEGAGTGGITAPEGSVEYWNQMRESLGMGKLKE